MLDANASRAVNAWGQNDKRNADIRIGCPVFLHDAPARLLQDMADWAVRMMMVVVVVVGLDIFTRYHICYWRQ